MEFEINPQLQNQAMQKKHRSHQVFTFFVAVLIFCIGLGTGSLITSINQTQSTSKIEQAKQLLGSKNDPDFDLFWQVWNDVKKDHVKQPVDENKLLYGAIAGAVSGLDDPYSMYFTPEQSKEFMDEINGEFEGIGAEVAIKNDQLVVVTPIPSSPAMKAGIQPGDAILAIDGIDTQGMSLNDAVNKIRGKKDTAVKLMMQRGTEQSFELSIVRDRIHVDSVTSETLTIGDKRVVHVTINQFNNDTYKLFSAIASQITIDRPDGVVLDLRNNPGGYLDAAVDVLSEFVSDGSPVVYERKSDGKDIPYTTKGTPALADIPTVILMNAGSASASEIVAGALQDYKKATVIGTTSFGKGTVQDVRNYSDGSTLKLTIAQWLTPQKHIIDKTGVVPEFYKENAKDDYTNNRDPQLDAAKLFFSNNAEFLATVQPPTEEQKKPLSQK